MAMSEQDSFSRCPLPAQLPGVEIEIETDSRSDYGVRRKGLFPSLLNFDGYSGSCMPLVERPRVL
jgi:hypothetical protein